MVAIHPRLVSSTVPISPSRNLPVSEFFAVTSYSMYGGVPSGSTLEKGTGGSHSNDHESCHPVFASKRFGSPPGVRTPLISGINNINGLITERVGCQALSLRHQTSINHCMTRLIGITLSGCPAVCPAAVRSVLPPASAGSGSALSSWRT